MTDAARLLRTNLMYRRPELYDQLTSGDGLAHQAAREVTRHNNAVQSVLDLACGTGRDLEIFRNEYGWSGIGIDLQPQLVTHARAFRPELDVRVGDIRSVRLGQVFDLITCLGNSLAYLHTDTELAAAAATFADHARPGTMLIISTLTEPPTRTHVTSTFTRHDGIVEKVEIVADWDPTTKLHTTRRQWIFSDGSSETDHLVRRVTEPDELAALLHAWGFRVLSTDGQICAIYHPAERTGQGCQPPNHVPDRHTMTTGGTDFDGISTVHFLREDGKCAQCETDWPCAVLSNAITVNTASTGQPAPRWKTLVYLADQAGNRADVAELWCNSDVEASHHAHRELAARCHAHPDRLGGPQQWRAEALVVAPDGRPVRRYWRTQAAGLLGWEDLTPEQS